MEIKKLDELSNLKQLVDSLPKYNYQENLTKKLDYKSDDFTFETIFEIILWKTNRFPRISEELLLKINELRRDFNDNLAENILVELLDKQKTKGFDLPMASTLMRFINPKAFQIIDQRVYRILYGKSMKIPSNSAKKIEFYKKYLFDLNSACLKYDIDFKNADRIFYQLDKHAEVNKSISIKY